MKSAKNIGAALLLVLVIIVVAQNTEAVETTILFAKFSMPRALLLAVTLLTGIVIGLIAGSVRRRDSDDE